jgi:hypothetical protein
VFVHVQVAAEDLGKAKVGLWWSSKRMMEIHSTNRDVGLLRTFYEGEERPTWS